MAQRIIVTGTIITDILQYALKEVGVSDNLKKRYEEGKILRGEIFEGKKRATSGLLFKASQLGLDSNVLNSQERGKGPPGIRGKR